MQTVILKEPTKSQLRKRNQGKYIDTKTNCEATVTALICHYYQCLWWFGELRVFYHFIELSWHFCQSVVIGFCFFCLFICSLVFGLKKKKTQPVWYQKKRKIVNEKQQTKFLSRMTLVQIEFIQYIQVMLSPPPPWIKSALHFQIQLSHCRPISLASELPDPAQPVLYQPNLLLPSPIIHTSGHPAPHFCVEEKQGQHSGNESLSQIGVRVHSSTPCEASKSGEVGPAVCVGGDGLELEWSHTACLPRKHMKEGCVCLTVKKREKGRWQLSRGWLAVKMRPIFSRKPKLLFKDKVLGVGRKGRGQQQQN